MTDAQLPLVGVGGWVGGRSSAGASACTSTRRWSTRTGPGAAHPPRAGGAAGARRLRHRGRSGRHRRGARGSTRVPVDRLGHLAATSTPFLRRPCRRADARRSDGQLGGEGALEGGARFGAGDVGREASVSSSSRPEPDSLCSTDTISRSPALNPRRASRVAEATRQVSQPVADAILDAGQALLVPGLVRSRWVAVSRSRIGGSTVPSAANVQAIARARSPVRPAAGPGGARPRQARMAQTRRGQGRLPRGRDCRREHGACAGSFIAANDSKRTS